MSGTVLVSQKVLQDIIRDWLRCEASLVGEFSADMRGDWESLRNFGKGQVERLGLTWTDFYLPVYVREGLYESHDDWDWYDTENWENEGGHA